MFWACHIKDMVLINTMSPPSMILAGPPTYNKAKENPKTVEAHRVLQAGLVPLGRALQQGSSSAQLRDLAAAKGLLVQDVLRVQRFCHVMQGATQDKMLCTQFKSPGLVLLLSIELQQSSSPAQRGWCEALC